MNARSLTVTASTQPRVGRVLLGVLAALALVCATALAGPAPALAAGCLNEKGESNEAVRSEARSTQLPQCRAYELVSPVYTQDRGVLPSAWGGAAPGGEAANFFSEGAFAGAQSNYALSWYIARRGEEGWKTSWVGLPGTMIQGAALGTNISFDLTKDLVREHGVDEVKDSLFVSDDLAAAPAFSFTEATAYREIPVAGEIAGETPDLSHVVFEEFFGGRLSELAGVGAPAPEPPPQIVNLGPGGIELGPRCHFPGAEGAISNSQFHAISNSGAEVFFECGAVSYVRVNGSRTLNLGEEVFRGASEDGSKVFLSGAGGQLYMDAIDNKPTQETVTKKVLLTPGAPATYLRSSDDGSHVYFNSTGVFAANVNGNEPIKEKAEAGKENLYVYGPDPEHPGQYRTAFIAQALLGSVPFRGGTAPQAQVNGCPSKELGETVEAGCEGGRFFVFATTAKITPDDTSSAQQVFEYDAGSGGAGSLTRVSLGEGGYANNGNAGAAAATIAVPGIDLGFVSASQIQAETNTRALSDDGSTVVFSSARALSPRAVNGQPDVYEYHEGRVGLISTGHSLTPDEHAAITPSGRDVFFMTSENVVAQDSDGLPSLYDARIDGGFPAPLVTEGGCTGDSCQGPPSVPNLLGAPASATFSGLGNPAPPAPPPVKTTTKTIKCKKGFTKKKNKCVKSKPKKKTKTAKKASHNGRAK